MNCFICQKDITNSTKVISYYNYPDKIWDRIKKDWDIDFQKIFNGAMCSDCAKKDLEVAHKKAINAFNEWKKLPWYKRLFI